MLDTFRHKGLRKQLIKTIRSKGIENLALLAVMEELPRHFFMDAQFDRFAYQDKAFQIDAGQTISQPYTVAFQTQLLQIEKNDKVLEIGTGSGYQAAILCALGANLYTIERHESLYKKSKQLLGKLNFNASMYWKDGFSGLPQEAPFDKILMTCGAPEIPDKLIQQLAIGGIIVAPVGKNKIQTMKRLIKLRDDKVLQEDFGNFSFVPMLKGTDDRNKTKNAS